MHEFSARARATREQLLQPRANLGVCERGILAASFVQRKQARKFACEALLFCQVPQILFLAAGVGAARVWVHRVSKHAAKVSEASLLYTQRIQTTRTRGGPAAE